MATGSIKQTDTSTTGIITVIDNGGNTAVPNGSDINYLDMNLPSKGGVTAGDFVSFDIVQAGPTFQAANVNKTSGTGKVKQTDTSTTGVITVSNNGGFTAVANGSDINYLDMNLPSKGGVNQGDTVNFNFVQAGPDYQATNLIKVVTGPPDEGAVKTGTITGNLEVNGNTVTLKGAVVTGNVHVKNGGKLNIKPDDSGTPTIINKNVKAEHNAIVVFYKSEIKHEVEIEHCKSFTATGGKIGSDLQLDGNETVSVDGTTVGGDLECRKTKTSTVIINCNITGNLKLHKNAGCSQSGNTVGGHNSGCK